METHEKEAIVKKNVNSIMPIVERLYKNTDIWENVLDIINSIEINETRRESAGVVAYVTPIGNLHLNPEFFEQGPEQQKITLLHELAHVYVLLTDPVGRYYYGNTHRHPKFIEKFAESLDLLGFPVKNPTVKKLQYIIYTPTEPPSEVREKYFYNYYCPVCQDIFNATAENFKKEHTHAFK
jgi:hypothetical protein